MAELFGGGGVSLPQMPKIPKPPQIDEAAAAADAADMIRRRRGYAATVLTKPGDLATPVVGAKQLLGQ